MAPTTSVGLRVDEDLATALTAEAERTGASISDLVRGPLRAAYVRDRPVYGVGSRFSLVADAWAMVSHSAPDGADQRLAQLRADLAAGRAEFGVNTGNASQIIGPGYGPLVTEQASDRPLRDLCTTLPLTSPVPFGVPGTVTCAQTSPQTCCSARARRSGPWPGVPHAGDTAASTSAYAAPGVPAWPRAWSTAPAAANASSAAQRGTSATPTATGAATPGPSTNDATAARADTESSASRHHNRSA